jgi:chromate transporter
MSVLGTPELLALFAHFLVLSLLSVGGAMTTAPDMHRYLVIDRHWITDAEFTASVALAQAAPGPNVLFVAVLGWNVAGPLGAMTTLLGIMLPSTTLALWAARWKAKRSDTLAVRAFTAGLAPLTIGLLLATGWVLSDPARGHWELLALVALTVGVMLRSAASPMWMVAVGMLAGAFGWV